MTKKVSKPTPLWVYYVSLTLIVCATVILRSLGQLSSVFFNGQVIFRETDPYLQMRLAENMAYNGLSMLKWDYYSLYPDGAAVGYGPIISWFTNIIAHVISPNPSEHLIDMVGAWLPPVAAGLLCIAVYLLGREVFKSQFVGLIGAALVAITPSELLHRSLLGFTDHHILEVLFSTTAILCLIKAVNSKSWKWGIGFALSLYLYCINWIGWPLLPAIITGWLYFYIGIKKLAGMKRVIYFSSTAFIVVLVLSFIPQTRDLVIAFLSNMFLGFTGTIQEVKPTNPREFYLLYGLAGILSIGGIILAIKNKFNSLFLTWSIFFFVACITEKRWGYYATVPIALYASYFLYWIGEKVKQDWKPYVLAYCCIAILFVTYPYTLGTVKRSVDISPDWYNACQWMRYNTPEPFGSPEAYYSQEDIGKAGYGVFSWWDYGHYIIQVGRRVPLCSPTQQESKYYKFFVESDEDKANEVIKDINVGYVIIDDLMVSQIYYAIYRKVTGTDEGWQASLPESQIYKMYNDRSKDWLKIKQFGSVKIFERIAK